RARRRRREQRRIRAGARACDLRILVLLRRGALRAGAILQSAVCAEDARSDRLMGKSLFERAQHLLYQRSGTLTPELVRNPGGIGLGEVPARLVPDATSTAVCGFCSTGCGLEIHLREGEAVNLSPARDYSVNRGAACPKGWEALTPLHAKDRATRPLLR